MRFHSQNQQPSASLAGSVAELFAAEEERKSHVPTPRNEMGPSYRRGTPSQAKPRGARDPGMPLAVVGGVFDPRGPARPDGTVKF